MNGVQFPHPPAFQPQVQNISRKKSIADEAPSDEVKLLKSRLQDNLYLLNLEKNARGYLEAMCTKAFNSQEEMHDRLAVVNNEVIKLQKVCSEQVSNHEALEERMNEQQCIRQGLEQQFRTEQRLRKCAEENVAHLTQALNLMNRILQVQSQPGIEDLPGLVIERALLQREIHDINKQKHETWGNATPGLCTSGGDSQGSASVQDKEATRQSW